MIRAWRYVGVLGALTIGTGGCSSCSSETPPSTKAASSAASPVAAKTDALYKAEASQGMHDSVAADLAELVKSAKALQAAAPTPEGRGWDATKDAAAIASMREAWRASRIAYEHVEALIAAMFPDVDTSIDARYDDFLATLGDKGDDNLFDATGVTGMHAIERILFAPSMPKRAVEFEKTLPGYKPAAFPATAKEAVAFKSGLAQRLVDDVSLLEKQWRPARIDAGIAFSGLVLLMAEQQEKVNKAATGEEESRYADVTLFDLRHNLAGTTKIYGFFQPWLRARPGGGAEADKAIVDGFDKLRRLYDSIPGDGIPQPSKTWSSLNPSMAELRTPFGTLFGAVSQATDADIKGSLVYEMNRAAELLGFPLFKRR